MSKNTHVMAKSLTTNAMLVHTHICTSHLACLMQRNSNVQIGRNKHALYMHTVFGIQMHWRSAPHTVSTLTQHIKMRTCIYSAKRTREHCVVEVAASFLNQQGVEIKSRSVPDMSSSGHDTQRPHKDAAVSHPSNVCVCVVSTRYYDIIASGDND